MLIIAAIIALFTIQSPPASENVAKPEPSAVEAQAKSHAITPATSLGHSSHGNQ